MSSKTIELIKKILDSLYETISENMEIQLAVKFDSGIIIKGKRMSIIARNDQAVSFSPVFKDAYGNVVTVLGSTPSWSVSDSSLATVIAAEDGLSAVVSSTGVDGDVEVNMVVAADPSSSIEEVIGKATITFKPGKVAFVSLGGAVIDKPKAIVISTATFEVSPTPTETPAVTSAPTQEPEPTPSPVAPVPTETPVVTEEPTPAPTEKPAFVSQ